MMGSAWHMSCSPCKDQGITGVSKPILPQAAGARFKRRFRISRDLSSKLYNAPASIKELREQQQLVGQMQAEVVKLKSF